MQLHFYASIETINGIQQGFEMFVCTKEGKSDGMIHVSFDLKEYTVTKVVDSQYMFKVIKKEYDLSR